MLNLKMLFRRLSCFGADSSSLVQDSTTSRYEQLVYPMFSDIEQDHTQPDRLLPYLPVELFNAILLFSGDHDLCQVAQSSRVCHAVAVRLLYREIDLMPLANTVRCIRTLATHPEIALQVRRFHVSDAAANGSEVLPAFHKLLHKALYQMHNMVSLSLLVGGPHSFVLTGCSFRLKNFITACHWDAPLVKWLEDQDDITSALFCGKFHSDARISNIALPNLKRISASPLILAAVVPSRPVEEAELCLVHPWLLDPDVISTTLRILAYSSSIVHTLQFITHLTDAPEVTLEALSKIPEHLPKLASLAIHVVSGPVTKDVLDGLTSVFSSFSFLRSFMLLSKCSTDALHDEESTKSLAKIWHKSCNSLELVSFPDSIWVNNARLGWVTLKELEQILAEREKELEKNKKALADREQNLADRERDLTEREQDFAAQERDIAGRGPTE